MTAPGLPPPADLAAWLRREADRETLLRLLSDRLEADEPLRRAVAARMLAWPRDDGFPDLRGALETILDVTWPAGGWSKACDLVADVRDLTASARALVAGHPAAVLEFAEYALRRLDEAEEDVGGAFEEWPGFGEALRAFEDLHAAACRPAGRRGPALARDLFARELEATGEAYVGVAGRWAEALGTDGLAQYRLLAEPRWAEVPAVGPGGHVWYSSGPRRLAASLEWLARRDGDLDRLIELRARDLSRPERYAGIAEECRAAGRRDLALAWIERGLAAFGGGAGSPPRGARRGGVPPGRATGGRHGPGLADVRGASVRRGLPRARDLRGSPRGVALVARPGARVLAGLGRRRPRARGHPRPRAARRGRRGGGLAGGRDRRLLRVRPAAPRRRPRRDASRRRGVDVTARRRG